MGSANGGTGRPFDPHSNPRFGALRHAYRTAVGLRHGTAMTTVLPSMLAGTACREPSSQTSSNSPGSAPSNVSKPQSPVPSSKVMVSRPSASRTSIDSGERGASSLPYTRRCAAANRRSATTLLFHGCRSFQLPASRATTVATSSISPEASHWCLRTSGQPPSSTPSMENTGSCTMRNGSRSCPHALRQQPIIAASMRP